MIEELKPYTARRRERVKPKLAGLLSWLSRQKIIGGRGIRVYETDDGTSISLEKSARQFFIGAFNVTLLDEKTVSVGPGFVNGRMPQIGKIPLDEQPELAVPAGGKEPAFVALKVKVDKSTGRIPENDSSITVVCESPNPVSKDETGYHPLAVLQPTGGGLRLFQLAYFSYSHAYKNGKHFFVPS